jgi:hypothetical protein
MRDPPKWQSYTQSDTADVLPFRCIMVNTSGNVKVTNLDDEDVVLPSVVAGIPIPCLAKRVWSTGTTATTGVVGR